MESIPTETSWFPQYPENRKFKGCGTTTVHYKFTIQPQVESGNTVNYHWNIAREKHKSSKKSNFLTKKFKITTSNMRPTNKKLTRRHGFVCCYTTEPNNRAHSRRFVHIERAKKYFCP